MHFDDIIIGSGLSALGVALGLREKGRKAAIFAGAAQGFFNYPDAQIPARFMGLGGLGEYWHGVIPLSLHYRPDGFDEGAWRDLVRFFYPHSSLENQMGTSRYFVPRQAIRPSKHWPAMADKYGFQLVNHSIDRIEAGAAAVSVKGSGGHFSANRIWLCAGATQTPRLLQQSGLMHDGPIRISDHIIGYAGQVERSADTEAFFSAFQRRRGGIILPYHIGNKGIGFFTLRPARFDFATLDSGIEARAIFGLPTSKVISGLAGRMSPGLIAEALFTKFGLWRSAPRYNVYFQTLAEDSLIINANGSLSRNADFSNRDVIDEAIAATPFGGLLSTAQRDLYIPGVHLHGGLSQIQFNALKDMNIHVVDASALQGIGPEHHSFVMMARASNLAKSAS